jgi:hypothetical protein
MFFICLIIVVSFLLVKFTNAERDKAFASFPIHKNFRLIQTLMKMICTNKSEFALKLLTGLHDELGEVYLMHFHPFHCGFVVIADPAVAEKVSFHQPDRSRSFFYQILSKFTGHEGHLKSRSMQSGLLKFAQSMDP